MDGGRIDATARERGYMLELVVADTGVGFGSAGRAFGGSTELGPSLLRQRLAAMYRARASLTLVENAPSGVRATLRIPIERR